MNTKNTYTQNYFKAMFKNFSELAIKIKKSRENPYEIAGWIKKDKRENDILIYRVTATDKFIDTFTIFDIYQDNSILLNFSKEEIKYISSLAVLLLYKNQPKYKIAWENFRKNLNDGIVKIKDRDKSGFIKANIMEIEKNIAIIDEMSGRDAYNLGKEIGIRERILEEEIFKKQN